MMNQKKRYQHLLFDLDHTIWDFDQNSRAVILDLYDSFDLRNIIGVDSGHYYDTFSRINETMWLKYRQGFMKQDELRWKRFSMTLLEYKVVNEPLAKDMSQTYLQKLPNQRLLMPNAIEILDFCAEQGYDMHIITNGFEDTQLRKMENSSILHYFKGIITSEKSMSLKPHKDIYDYALKSIGTTSDDCLMIGDSYDADIVGAQNVDIDQVFYDPFKLNMNSEATYTIHDLIDLKKILSKN